MNPKALLIAYAREIGLNTKHTAGGCMALSLETSGNNEILITDDGDIPTSLGQDDCIMGVYDEYGQCILTKHGRAIDLISLVSSLSDEVTAE